MAQNTDLENKFIHCNVETDFVNDGSIVSDIVPLEDSPGLPLHIEEIEDNTEWYISGDTINNSWEESATTLYIQATYSGKTYESPRMTIRQHRKPDEHKFADLSVRLANDAYSSGMTSVDVGQRGGRIIVSAFAITNEDVERHMAKLDAFNLKIHNVYFNIVTPVGIGHEVDDVNGKRVEWILNVSRNEDFDDRSAILFCEFTDENSGKKGYKSITITQSAREHTYTKPVLSISETSVDYNFNYVAYEAYYTIDGIKQKVDKFLVNGEDISSVSEVGLYPSADGLSGRFGVDVNWNDEEPETSFSARSFNIVAVVEGENGAILGEKLGIDGNVSNDVTIWQDNYIGTTHTYTFNITPYHLPSKALTNSNQGIKTWINHVPSDVGTLYVDIQSVMDDGNYNSGVTVSIVSGGEYISSHGWGLNNEYKITLNEFIYDEEDEDWNDEREIVLEFVQKDISGNPIKKFKYNIIQLDNYYTPLYIQGTDSNIPNYFFLTLGSDLLTGNGLNAYGTVYAKGKFDVGNDTTEVGDSSSMSLYWGGQNTNFYGNQYIVFSPNPYIESNQTDVRFELRASTQSTALSNGIVSINLQALNSKPTILKSNKQGIRNVLMSSGTVYKEMNMHGRLLRNGKTLLLSMVRYWSDNSCYVRQNPPYVPKYSIDENREGLDLQYQLNGNVSGSTSFSKSLLPEYIKTCGKNSNVETPMLISRDGEYLSATTNTTSFEKMEMYYDSTKYKLVKIGRETIGVSDTYHEYDKSNLSDMVDFNFKDNSDDRKYHFFFDVVDEMNEAVTGYVERTVMIYNTTAQSSITSKLPLTGFNGRIYDPITKNSTDYTISSGPQGLDVQDATVGTRKITWKDISNGSMDSSRRLRLLSIDKIENNKLYDQGLNWIFKGFRNANTSTTNVSHTYTPIDTFQYAFNSSTPCLELGFEEVPVEKEKVHLGFQAVNIGNISDILHLPKGGQNNLYFTDANFLYKVYKWKGSNNPTVDDYNKLFIEKDETFIEDNLSSLMEGINTQSFYFGGFDTWTVDNLRNRQIYDITFNDEDINNNSTIIILFEIYDCANFFTYPGKKRFVFATSMSLATLKNYPCILLDGGKFATDIVNNDTTKSLYDTETDSYGYMYNYGNGGALRYGTDWDISHFSN
jgi:hypothetical protein